jgi:hypothetical protein
MGPSERNQYVTCEVNIVCRASNHDIMFTDQLNLLFSVEFAFTIALLYFKVVITLKWLHKPLYPNKYTTTPTPTPASKK